jgi:TRAP-type mannitol/chloroaromatic compound transport system substrate-binding protein
MRIFIKSLGGAACLALTLTSGASAQDIRWNMQSAFNGNWPALGDSGVYFAEKIGEATDGRISIRGIIRLA